MIKYISDASRLEKYDISGFFVGWLNPPSEAMHRKMLIKSKYIWLAIDDKRVVGFINAISDETLSAYIPLLEVLPEYKEHGIGSKLVELMFESLSDHYMIDIVCDNEIVPFYERFKMHKSSGMIIRNYGKQSGF